MLSFAATVTSYLEHLYSHYLATLVRRYTISLMQGIASKLQQKSTKIKKKRKDSGIEWQI